MEAEGGSCLAALNLNLPASRFHFFFKILSAYCLIVFIKRFAYENTEQVRIKIKSA